MPQLGCLPVHSANQTPNHRSRGLFYLRQAKVSDLCDSFRGDENVRGFAVTMNDGRLASVEVL